MLIERVKALAPWWPCACLKCVSGLRDWKNLNFLRFIRVFDPLLKVCSDIIERNLLQLLSYIIVFMGKIAPGIGMSFFSSMFQLEVFSYCIVTGTSPNGIQSLFDNDWVFLVFFVGIRLVSSTSYLLRLNSA